MEKKESFDLAKGTFLEKWPTWSRWILFIPAAIIIPPLIYLIQSTLQTWYLDIGPNAFHLILMRGIMYGGGFIFVGAFVAPNSQKIVALILMIILSMIMGMSLFSAYLMKSPLTTSIEGILMIISAGVATFYIFKEEDVHS